MNRAFISGKPVPQGSLKFINGHAIHVRATDLAVWRADIARGCANFQYHEGPVSIELKFVMQRPKTVKREHPHVRPDLDKLIRAVLDGLTGVGYRDDEQVVSIDARKTYGSEPGVFIALGPVTAGDS